MKRVVLKCSWTLFSFLLFYFSCVLLLGKNPTNKPSPGSTTMDDVIDSLLGLPPASRTPSPGPVGRLACNGARVDFAGRKAL